MTTIEKIRAEIERRNLANYCWTAEQYEEELFAILDTLEEPVSEDLEKAATDYASDFADYWQVEGDNEIYSNIDKIYNAFKAGAEWMKAKMMDEWLKDRDGCFWDGVNEGKKAMKEQMMKDAVEGKVIVPIYDEGDIWSTEIEIPGRFEPGGSKIKIIIVKEDDK